MARAYMTGLLMPALLIAGFTSPVQAGAGAEPANARRCSLQPMTISLDRSSFGSVAGYHRPGAAAALATAFGSDLARSFQEMCQRKRITPAVFRGVSRVQLLNAEGDTDGHFVGQGTPRGSISFEYFFDSMKPPPRAAIANGLECLAHPSDACFED